jgi:hypothetical protein
VAFRSITSGADVTIFQSSNPDKPIRMVKNRCGPEESSTGENHGRFQLNPQAVQKGCSARPQRVKIRGRILSGTWRV